MKLISQEELYTSFEAESREEWGDKITQSLGPDIDLSIVEACIGTRPIHSYPKWQHQFEIGEYFELKASNITAIKELNTQILSALVGGVQHIYLRVLTPLTVDNLDAIFDQVKLDYIKTTLIVNENDELTLPTSWNPSNYTLRKDSNHSLSLNNTLSQEETIAHCIQVIALEIQTHTAATQFNITVKVGDSYLMEIAKMRALHHTFNLLNSMHDWKYSLNVEAYYDLNASSESDYQKIANTSRGLAAILGGATVIVPFGLEPTDKEEVRIARNQLHLLRLESYVDHVADPLAGSHYIEYRTDSIAKAAWERLSKLQTT